MKGDVIPADDTSVTVGTICRSYHGQDRTTVILLDNMPGTFLAWADTFPAARSIPEAPNSVSRPLGLGAA
jgi:hypothetical protein